MSNIIIARKLTLKTKTHATLDRLSCYKIVLGIHSAYPTLFFCFVFVFCILRWSTMSSGVGGRQSNDDDSGTGVSGERISCYNNKILCSVAF